MYKPKLFKRLALAAALLPAATPQVIPSPTALVTQQQEKQLPPNTHQKQMLQLNDYGGLNTQYSFPSRSPKEYGQYLQSIGKQKWVKKK